MKRLIFVLVIIVVVAAGYIAGRYNLIEPVKSKIGAIVNAYFPDTKSPAESAEQQAEGARPDKEQTDDKDAGKEIADPNAPSDKEAADPNAPSDKDTRGKGRSKKGKSRRDGKKDDKEIADPNAPVEKDPMVAINLNNVEMKQIMSKLADWTGKVILPSDEAMKVKITIYSPKEVRQSRALSFVYDALRGKGIIAEVSDDKIVLKPIAQAKFGYVQTLSADEPLARIVDKSQIVEKYFKLKNASPLKLVNIITPLTAEYGHVTAVESTGIIAVIDTVENLMRIQRIIDQFDIPESEQIVEKVFEIVNGDAAEIVQVLQLILTQKPPKKVKPTSGGSKGDSKVASSVIIEAGQVPIILLPLQKHNWIIARASADDIARIGGWIEKLDIGDSIPPEQTVITVEYADVRQVAELARNAIREMYGRDLAASVVIEAVPQSRQIVVIGTEENRNIVKRLIAEIDMPAEDIYEQEVFKLKYADPDKIKQNIEGLYESQAGSYSSYSYRAASRSSRYGRVEPKDVVKVVTDDILKQVTVIATKENIIKITAQIKEWDMPLELKEDQYRIISLKNSDPVQMVNLLNTFFAEDEGGVNSWIRRYLFPDEGDTKAKIVGNLYGLLKFEAVPETKKIIIISKIPEAYDVIEKLIIDLDSQEEGEVPHIITLNYADAEDLCDQLNGILNPRGTRSLIPRKDRGLTLTSEVNEDGAPTGNNQQNSTPDMITPWWDQGQRSRNEMPASNMIGKIRFVPVHRSKAIMVLAPPEYMDEIRQMVADLDKPGKQVMIEAVIIEVDHASMTSLGVQLSSGAFTGMGENSLTALMQIAHAGSRGEFTSGDLNLNQGFTTNLNINVLVDLLAKTVNAKVLNRPTLWTKDNEEALFFKGEEFAIIESDQRDNQGGGLNRSYTYTKVGVELKVRPNITPEKDVDMMINLEISSKSLEREADQPIIKRLYASSNVIVKDGQTIMLGGILFQTDSLVKTKVPFFGDLPIVGGLFRHSDTILRNSELLVFITPHVIDGKSSEAAKKYIEKSHGKGWNRSGRSLRKLCCRS